VVGKQLHQVTGRGAVAVEIFPLCVQDEVVLPFSDAYIRADAGVVAVCWLPKILQWKIKLFTANMR